MAAASPHAEGAEGEESKRLRAMTEQFSTMGIKAAVGINQQPDWYKWDGVVMVAVVPHRKYGSAWVVALDLSTSALVCRRFDPSDYPGSSMTPVGPKMPLANSERWNTTITKARALSEGLSMDAVGKATVEFCIALHYNRENQTLLGVDTGGLYQLWTLRSGAEILSGRFVFQTKEGINMGVVMNAICHTE